MIDYRRFAIFAVPTGPLYDAGAAWLGWDSMGGTALPHPAIGLDAAHLTERPRRYGFHGTVHAPFRLSPNQTQQGLHAAIATHSARMTPITIPDLVLRSFGGFAAILPAAPCEALTTLAADTLRALDPFRAPLTPSEVARRNQPHLSPRQQELLMRWGYPHVLDEFRFHMTLTGRIGADPDRTIAILADHFAIALPRPFTIPDLALMSEEDAGLFHLIARHPLGGP
jgi:hypothetical protein